MTETTDDLLKKIESLIDPDDSVVMPMFTMASDDPLPARGRPPTPDHLKKTERLAIPMTAKQLQDIHIAAAKAGVKRPKDWALEVLLKAAKEQE